MAHLKKNKRPNNKCKYISTSDQTNKAADFTDDYDVDDDDVWLPLIEFKIEDKIELRNSANSTLPTMTMMMMSEVSTTIVALEKLGIIKKKTRNNQFQCRN